MHSWSQEEITSLQNLKKKIIQMKMNHFYISKKLNRIYNLFMVISIILGPLSGFLSNIHSFLHPEQNIVIPILSATIAYISGIIIAVIKFGNYKSKGLKHKSYCIKFNILESSIFNELNIQSHKQSYQDYYEWLHDNFELLIKDNTSLSIMKDTTLAEHKNINTESIDYKKNMDKLNPMFLYEFNRFTKTPSGIQMV